MLEHRLACVLRYMQPRPMQCIDRQPKVLIIARREGESHLSHFYLTTHSSGCRLEPRPHPQTMIPTRSRRTAIQDQRRLLMSTWIIITSTNIIRQMATRQIIKCTDCEALTPRHSHDRLRLSRRCLYEPPYPGLRATDITRTMCIADIVSLHRPCSVLTSIIIYLGLACTMLLTEPANIAACYLI